MKQSTCEISGTFPFNHDKSKVMSELVLAITMCVIKFSFLVRIPKKRCFHRSPHSRDVMFTHLPEIENQFYKPNLLGVCQFVFYKKCASMHNFFFFFFFAAQGLCCSTWDLHCIMQGLSLWDTDTMTVALTLCGCDMWPQLLCSMWDLNSLTRNRTIFLALQSRFLTTDPPGKSP